MKVYSDHGDHDYRVRSHPTLECSREPIALTDKVVRALTDRKLLLYRIEENDLGVPPGIYSN